MPYNFRSDDRAIELKMKHIEIHGVNLTPWEDDFVGSVRAQLEAGHTLTDKQAEVLERIYVDRTP